jgi:glycosyltransferase involved in cell wall biosynthesis
VSISRIIEQETQAEVRVITRDRDAEQTQPYPIAAIRDWIPYRRAQVAYLRPGVRDWPWVIRQLREWQPDLIYFNSLQSPWFSLLPHLLHRIGLLPAKQVLLAPRGETSPGARQLKGLKKKLARPLIKQLLNHPLTWHASSDLEESEILAWWGGPSREGHRMLVASNPPPAPASKPSKPPYRQTPRIVFASRIDRKKGLLELVQAMQSIDIGIDLHVYGVVRDDSYWSECQEAARKLPTNVAFRYFGEFHPTQSASFISDADLFVLPTYGENFGQVIAEALSVGCPVLLPPTTPWTALVAQTGGVAESADAIRNAILHLCASSEEERALRRRSVHLAYSNWFDSVNSNMTILDQLTDTTTRQVHEQ